MSGEIVELYRFSRGATVWTYTSAALPVDYNAETYTPESLSRGADEQGEEINRAQLTVTLPRGNPVPSEFVAYSPEGLLQLTVYRQVNSVTGVIWQGRVVGCAHRGDAAELRCEPIFTSLRRAGLSSRFSTNCRHFLYGTGCNVDPEDFKVTVTVASIDGLNVTATGLDAQEDGWFQAGHMIAPNGEQRMILAHAGNVVTITAPIQDLAVSDSIDVFPGCPHTREACNSKFDNILNYGGFPFIPLLNPFGTSIQN
ncbi:MAG: phage BR0599 family protein [Aeromonas veronii]